MKMKSVLILIALAAAVQTAPAEWPCRPDRSVLVSAAEGDQTNVRLAPDGKNGAIMVWQDRRGGTEDKLYLQRFDASGKATWAAGGIALSNSEGLQFYPQVAADGSGGAFVVWQDSRYGNYDIFAQRISPVGVTLWTAGGIAVCIAEAHQYYPQVASDGTGGMVVVWQDRRNGQFDVYAQRLDGFGRPQWTENGLAVCSALGDQVNPQVTGDGAGGGIIAWADARGSDQLTDIYSQRILAGGAPAWTFEGGTSGVPLCRAQGAQSNVQLVSDGRQGAVAAWQDRRSGPSDRIFAQSVSSGGVVRWTKDGVALADAGGLQYYPRLIGDGTGGAVSVWQDNRVGGDYDVFAQRVGADGVLRWPAKGLEICAIPGHQYYPQVLGDNGYFLCLWQDKRNGTDFDVYAQRIDSSGAPQWVSGGVEVAGAPADQVLPQMASDGLGGAIVAWADYRNNNGFKDLFAQRIGANGRLAGGCYRSFTQDSLALKGVRLGTGSSARRKSPTVGNVRDSIFGRGEFPDGVVVGLERADSLRYYGWEYFTKPYYVRLALPQRGTPRSFKTIFGRPFIGQQKNLRAKRYSNRLAGENLALKLNIAASDVGLTETGFGDIVFRDPASPKNPLNGRSLREVTEYADSILTMWQYYSSRAFAIDTSLRNINAAFSGPLVLTTVLPILVESTKPLFAVPFLVPGQEAPAPRPPLHPRVMEEEAPQAFVLLQNYPNPFNPVTTIEFTLAEPSLVTLRVYNVLGQEVATLLDETAMESGRQIADFDAADYPSGVYYYRLQAIAAEGDRTPVSRVRKMILLR